MNYNSLTKYAIALASCCAAHYSDKLVIVFTFKIYIFAKNKIFIYLFFRYIYSLNSEVHTLDKHSYTLCNRYLRSFNFTIIFHNYKKDENAHIHVNSPL